MPAAAIKACSACFMALAKPHPRSTAVLFDELHAGRFKGAADHVESRGAIHNRESEAIGIPLNG